MPVEMTRHWKFGTLVMLVLFGGYSFFIDKTLSSSSFYHAAPEEEPIVHTHDVTGSTQGDYSWTGIFSFVPNGIYDCEELFRKDGENNKEDILPETFKEAKRKFLSVLERTANNETLEGHSGNILEETLTYYRIAQAPVVKTVCETGFNAGHSTLMWLKANPKTQVYSFDMGSHEYSRPMAQYLDMEFPGRLHVTWGDSTVTLPAFRKAHPEVTCDLLIIDGGHTHDICQSDYDNFKQMASNKSIILLDNYPDKRRTWQRALGDVWEQAKQKGEIIEIFQCRYMQKPDGFSVGRMNV